MRCLCAIAALGALVAPQFAHAQERVITPMMIDRAAVQSLGGTGEVCTTHDGVTLFDCQPVPPIGGQVGRSAGEMPVAAWRGPFHFACLGALVAATILDLHSTERAILAGATEANPLYEPLVADRDFTDFRVARLSVGVGLAGLLAWLYQRATHPLERTLATGACVAATSVSIIAGGNNLRVARQLEGDQR